MKRFPIALAVAVALMGATSAFAQDVEINGSNVRQNVNANNNVANASGLNSVADQAAGAITDAEINGSNIDQNVNANNNVSNASGLFSRTCQEFGVIGDAC